MNGLKLRESEIKWNDIIQMAFNRENWGKTYLLFTHERLTISIQLSNYNFKRKYAEFDIRLTYPKEEESFDNSRIAWLMYYTDNYSQEDIMNLCYKKVRTMLKDEIFAKTKEIAEEKYKEQHIWSWEITDEQRETIPEFEAINELPDGDIKETAMEKLNEDLLASLNEIFEENVDIYIEEHPIQNKSINAVLAKIANHLD